jgi:hypothetical protein
MALGEYVLVATIRGNRSDWFRNVAVNPNVRYWLNGQKTAANAVVLGIRGKAETGLPAAVATMTSAMTTHAELLGWRYAVLVPDRPFGA